MVDNKYKPITTAQGISIWQGLVKTEFVWHGIQFDKGNNQIRAKEVKLYGHLFSEKEILVDKNKIKAIESMKILRNKKDSNRLLDMTTYYVQKCIKAF